MVQLKCPKCGRFSKVIVSEDNRELVLFSDCSVCGEIKVEGRAVEERIEEKTDYVTIFLIIFVIIFGGVSAFLYYQVGEKNLEIDAILALAQDNYSNLNESYRILESNYLSLLNTSAALEGYYSDLQDMYSSIRSEYSILEDSNSNLIQDNSKLLDDYFSLLDEKEDVERELDELLTFSKDTFLDNLTVEILPEGNVTLFYDIEYAGYLEVNFSSSVDIIFWVGSSGIEGTYYARYPDYPNTAFNGTFKIPVIETAYLYIGNPNEEFAATVSFTVRYIY